MMLFTVSNEELLWGQPNGEDLDLPFRYALKDPNAVVITEKTGGRTWDTTSDWLGRNVVKDGKPAWEFKVDLPMVVKWKVENEHKQKSFLMKKHGPATSFTCSGSSHGRNGL